MALADFTTFNDIRAALGVSEDEIEDATLSLQVYEFSLVSEMEDINESLISGIATVREIDPGQRTAVQTRLIQTATLFATYSVARHLTTSLPLFSPKDITDGKASISRYAANPYKDVIDRVERLFERFKARLAEVYASYSSQSVTASVARTYFAKSTPSTDPVTGS